FSKEAILWGQLSNPYVLPFCGVYRLPDNPSQLCLVSPWMANGNLSQYLGQKPQANRLSLLLDVALGLEYLHSFDPQVIHGDLKGANILITPDERACLADFGLSTIAQEANIAQSILTNSSLSPGSIPWMAPELLSYTEPDRKYKSGPTDMYSFGCVCYEVYAGRPRFSEFTLPQAIMALAHNQRPARPQNLDLDDAIWGLIERCWDADSESRPKASEAVCQLQSHPGVPRRGEPVDQVNDFASRLLASLANAPLATPVIPEETVALSYFSSQQQLNSRPLKAFTPGGMERVPSTTPSLGNSIRSSVYSDELATITENDIVIALMGPTGTGKSSFINTARRRSSAPVGESLESCTQSVRAYSCLHPDGSGRNVVFVDTPGFDDSHRTDYAILKDIAKWMEETYRHRIKLTGILYLHNIAESRMRGAPMRNKDMFEELCGAGALQNVVLTTTMWDDVAKDVGVRREIQLQTQFWGAAMAYGCRSTRFSYTFQSAWEIVGMFDDVVPQALQLQTQIVDEKKPLHETSAYAVLVRWWTQMTRKFRDLVRRRVGSPQDREIMQNTLLFAEKQAKALENLGSSGKTFATFLSPKARNSRN
ncbi:kinase-like domain-containing protein, partial [Hygrophoropsis aurantiaca]